MVVVVDVALNALRAGQVEAGKRPAGARVIKTGATPVCSVVACRTIGREPRRSVVRIGGAVVIRHVTCRAGAAGQAVIPVHVALRARHGRVKASQCKSCSRVIESCISPRSRVVALLAGLRKIGLHVIGISRVLKIFEVTRHARRAGQVVVVIDVA